nr:unnamed protein product [Callosobruchus chinensis]
MIGGRLEYKRSYQKKTPMTSFAPRIAKFEEAQLPTKFFLAITVKMFDTEQFISEIESRAALYDLQHCDYANRDIKIKLWLEVATKLIPRFEELPNEGKNEEGLTILICLPSMAPMQCGKLLRLSNSSETFCQLRVDGSGRNVCLIVSQIASHVSFTISDIVALPIRNSNDSARNRKWKSIRDSFMRELRVQKNTPSGSGNKNRKKYVFFEQLLFLIPTMKNIETSSNVENHETEASIDTTTHETEGTSVQTHRSRKRKVLFEEQVLGYLNSKQDKHTSNMDDEDDDKLFLLSLLRPIKALPQQTRFGLRMQMMQLVQNATQQQQQCQQYRRPEQYQTPAASITTFSTVPVSTTT